MRQGRICEAQVLIRLLEYPESMFPRPKLGHQGIPTGGRCGFGCSLHESNTCLDIASACKGLAHHRLPSPVVLLWATAVKGETGNSQPTRCLMDHRLGNLHSRGQRSSTVALDVQLRASGVHLSQTEAVRVEAGVDLIHAHEILPGGCLCWDFENKLRKVRLGRKYTG